MSAPRPRRRALLAGTAAVALVGGYALLASGVATAAPPLLAAAYLVLIPAALLA